MLLCSFNLGASVAGPEVIGWRKDNVICVLAIVDDWVSLKPPTLYHLRQQSLHELNAVIKVAGIKGDTGGLTYLGSLGQLERRHAVVRFRPPDPVRLQYLTAGNRVESGAFRSREDGEGDLSSHLDEYGPQSFASAEQDTHEIDIMLKMINSTCTAQRAMSRLRAKRQLDLGTPIRLLRRLIHILSIHILLPPLLVAAVGLLRCQVVIKSRHFGSLADMSCLAAQVSLRLQQFLEGPDHFQATLHQPEVSLEERSKVYMGFWNTVWLVVNDLIIGYCFHAILHLNIAYLSNLINHFIQAHFVNSVVLALGWLDDWPVGLKLNTPLSHFYCSSLGMLISSWSSFLLPILPSLTPIILTYLSFLSMGGCTVLLAAIQDLIQLATLHLEVSYRLTRAVCVWQLESLGGLWNLFRGKRWNVLRQRTDSYQYDIDQLFLGTLLFTVSAFLFPTVLTYAALFAVIASAIHTVVMALGIARSALNAFPLFEVLLRAKEPSRLPAGIHFRLQRGTTSMRAGEGGYVTIVQNSPKSLMAILKQVASG